MAADIKALRTRIKSVTSTHHLTTAMGLVASSKIRRATDAMVKSRQYAEAVTQTIGLLTACAECRKSAYMRTADTDAPRTRLIVIAGDRGMAGGYNANIFRLTATYPDAEIVAIGKRACDRYGQAVLSSEDITYAEARDIAAAQCAAFAAGEYDRLGIVRTQYISMMSQQPMVQWILPLTAAEDTQSTGVIFEPDERTILDAAVPEYVVGELIAAIRESFNCEVVARRMAMDSAGKNAQTMLDDLQLRYNRARQGNITQEITEIVAGS